MATTTGLESLVDQIISVITNDGRNIVGVLKGFDQATNIILDESHERVFSTKVVLVQLCSLSEHPSSSGIGHLISSFTFLSFDMLFCLKHEGVQQHVLGLYIIRGDNIGVIGELDEELDASLDFSKLRAHPLKPVVH
ncbi:BnaA07g25380D [Brassica napus]|uniref:U6 snRNA-associated Sm-like protein LSm8 n=1 Tax=Brassica napus TaxID=3708 RepID=A0A078F3A8_BRANA|nr:BnaA07g25380D [Brassica napus]